MSRLVLHFNPFQQSLFLSSTVYLEAPGFASTRSSRTAFLFAYLQAAYIH